ncbi:MAG: acyltransferase [Acidimicrobiia bacterium]
MTSDDELLGFGDARTSSGSLRHLPGLDGLRGIAVAAVVCFHGGWGWMRGGFLGVSLFFTLSGFLITSLLLSEANGSRRISLVGFWVRRGRRLLPAAWLTLGAALVLGALVLEGAAMRQLPGDVFAALCNVANWHFLVARVSYAQLFSSPSPVLHFWSLAIEEQFYLVFPLVVAVIVALGGRWRSRLAAFAVTGIVVSWSLPIVLGWSADRVYYGTDTRAGELLVGVVLALLVARPGFRAAVVRRFWPRFGATAFGTLALVGSLVLWTHLDRASAFLGRGGFALQALLSAGIILAATLPVGPVRRLTTLAPLRRLGRISYAVYLFHWPLFVWLTPSRTGLGRAATFVVVVATSVLLAELSARVLELPIRRGRGVLGVEAWRPSFVVPVVLVALIAGIVAVGRAPVRAGAFDADTASATLASLRHRRTAPPAAPPQSTVPPPRSTVPPPRYAFFGDSISLSLALATAPWESRTHGAIGTDGMTVLGCGIVRGGLQRAEYAAPVAARCDAWPRTWAAAMDKGHADLALVMSGQWELVDHKLAGDSQWRHAGDPVYDDVVRREYLAATDLLASKGAVAVWITVPHFGPPDTIATDAMRSYHDPVRVDRVNQIIREVVAARPATARLIDLATWMQTRVDDRVLRKDGAHFNFDDHDHVGVDFIGPQLVDVWNDVWRSRHH